MEVAPLRRLRKQILRDQPAALIISHPVFSLYLSLSAEESAGAESHAAARCDPELRYSLREAGVSCMHKHCIAALQRGFAALQHCSALQLWRRSDGQNPRIGGICRRELGSVSSWKTFEEGARVQSTGDLVWYHTGAQFLHKSAKSQVPSTAPKRPHPLGARAPCWRPLLLPLAGSLLPAASGPVRPSAPTLFPNSPSPAPIAQSCLAACWGRWTCSSAFLQPALLFLGGVKGARRGSLLLRRIGESVELSAAHLKGSHLFHFLVTSRGPSASSSDACNTQQRPTPPGPANTRPAGAHPRLQWATLISPLSPTHPHPPQSRSQSHPLPRRSPC